MIELGLAAPDRQVTLGRSNFIVATADCPRCYEVIHAAAQLVRIVESVGC